MALNGLTSCPAYMAQLQDDEQAGSSVWCC